MSTVAFSTPALLRNPHVQTLGAALSLHAPPRGFREPAAQWRKIPLPGGGHVLTVGWFQPGARPLPTVLLVHGVGGSSASQYLVRAAVAFHRAGYHVVRMNLRGAGDSVAFAPSLYHAGLAGDLRVVLDALALDARVARAFVLGVSLGGNLLLKALGVWGSDVPAKLAGAAAVSAPLDLAPVSRWLERASTFPYRAYVVANLLAQAERFRELHPARAHWAKGALRKVRTVWEYDERVVAPMHGFRSARAYYEEASAGPGLGRIEVPTLLVHAEDDPMVPGALVAPALRGRSAATELAWSATGGHVGWFAGVGEDAFVRTWAVARALPFFARLA